VLFVLARYVRWSARGEAICVIPTPVDCFSFTFNIVIPADAAIAFTHLATAKIFPYAIEKYILSVIPAKAGTQPKLGKAVVTDYRSFPLLEDGSRLSPG
jgi:hypothetical protein